MVLSDRDRLMVSILLGSAVYIFAIVFILLFMELGSRNKNQFEDLVYVELARDTQIVDLSQKSNKKKDNRKNNDSKKENRENTARKETENAASSSRTRTGAPAASSGSPGSKAAQASTRDSGTAANPAKSTSFSSRGTAKTFSSKSNASSDFALPDYRDADSNDAFFNDEEVSSYKGTADPKKTFSSSTESRGNTVLDTRDTSSESGSRSFSSGSNSTSGLGFASGDSSSRNNTRTKVSGDSDVIVDKTGKTSQNITVSETSGSHTQRSVKGRESSSGSSRESSSSSNASSGSDKANAELYGIDVEGDARFRRITSGPDKHDLEEKLRPYRAHLPPSKLIRVKFTVTPQGAITDLELEKGLGYSKADAAVIQWIRQFHFSAVDDAKGSIDGVISIQFNMD